MSNATTMPFSAQDIQIMPQRQIDYVIAECLFGWTRISQKGLKSQKSKGSVLAY